MSLRKPNQSGDGDGPKGESRRDRKRRQQEAVKRQKALVARERKRRSEQEKSERRAEKPAAKAPESKAKRPAERQRANKPEDKQKAKRPEAEKQRRRRRIGAVGGAKKVGGGARKIGGGVAAVGLEALKLAREMLVIPWQLWLGLAEGIGKVVLAVWMRAAFPLLRLTGRVLRALLHFGERHITPARALTVVALVAVGALVAAQWRDYSAISVGVDAYSGDVGAVAPPPEVSSAPTHDAHGWVMIIIAALSVLAILGAVIRRRRLAIWLVPLGIAVIAISVGIDAPKGLDEGDAAVVYESASASLLSGFWLQIATGAVLIACGLLIPGALQRARSASRGPVELGPSLIDRFVARVRRTIERRRAQPKRKSGSRRLPKLRRPAAKGNVEGARP